MINKDITSAHTLPSAFYRSEAHFDQLKENAFRKSWHFAGTEMQNETNVVPFDLLPGFINEPLLLTKDRNQNTHCLSNVCTHRGNLLVEEAGNHQVLRCRYHGRCFGTDGQFRSMPGFEDVKGFPSKEDHLTHLPLESIGPMLFTQLQAGLSFNHHFSDMLKVMSWFNFDDLELRPEASKSYSVNAHWALYVDNYLEGFHVPFVHPGLNEALDVHSYEIKLFENAVLQVGMADDSESDIMDIPAGTEYSGQRIYAFYWWVFPNLMFNFYPWGVSLNIIEPVNLNKTNMRFLTFVFKDQPTPDMSGLHQTELEDEKIVEAVQRGMQSSFYDRGRYSPIHETAVHHFHRMISNCIHV